MTSQLHLDTYMPLPLTVFLLLLTVTTLTLLYNNFSKKNSSPPLFVPDKGNQRRRWLYDSENLLQEGYRKFYGKPFSIWTTEGKQIVIPPDYVDELKMLPDHIFPSALRMFFLHKYIWPIKSSKLDYGHVVMRNDLNKNMGLIFPEIRDDIDVVFPFEFPESRTWCPINLYPRILRLVSRVNGKIFIGESLYRNEEWINISCNYTRSIFISSAKLRFFPPFLRPFVQFFISELRTVWKCNAKAVELLTPIIQQRQREENNGDYKKPNDAIEWLRDLSPEPDKNDPLFHAISQLGIGAVSVNTTTQLLTNAIFNLAVYPGYVSILREEIAAVRAEMGTKWTLESMGKLKKMDSFIKETLRYNGHLTATFQRQALRPITLSDGTSIPSGTFTFSPANAINFDPDVHPDPDNFDGLRFYNLRQTCAEYDKKFQLTSITKTQLQFGSGRHACPGRWFASHQIKLVLIAVLDRFEMRLKDREERPKRILFQTNQLPDPTAEILFRDRK